jgi:hypothetical protein
MMGRRSPWGNARRLEGWIAPRIHREPQNIMKHDSITSLPPAPAAERGHRMLEYTVMMSIRVLCLISLIWVRGWWIVIPAAGAVFLPYFAVVVANVTRSRPAVPERPGSIVRVDGMPGAGTWEAADGDPEQPEGSGDAAQPGASENAEQTDGARGRDGENPHGQTRAGAQQRREDPPR